MRLSENAHLLRYPHPSSLRRTSMYASFLGISEALHLDIFHQPLISRFLDSLDWALLACASASGPWEAQELETEKGESASLSGFQYRPS
jgi:hypothetical protein